jgi:hypothetical protein
MDILTRLTELTGRAAIGHGFGGWQSLEGRAPIAHLS